jgi:beta-galactosidase/beta-glucuronidase
VASAPHQIAADETPAPEAAASIPRPEYPRPLLRRQSWLNLNGEWEFAFDDADRGVQDGWCDGRSLDGRITVPFPYQSALSGVGDKGIHEVVWYARSFTVSPEWRQADRHDLLLHFGAVDYRSTLWLNGQEVGHNRGGHVPFTFDVAPYLVEGENRLTLRVEDRQDPHQPRGKQAAGGVPGGIDYYCTTGIWQTVWLEPVPIIRIEELTLTPYAQHGAEPDAIEVCAYLHAPAAAWRIQAEAWDGQTLVAQAETVSVGAVAQIRLPLAQPKRWSPETPHLYALRVRLSLNGELLDQVESYFALRTVRLRDGRFQLNGRPTYLKMVLDQGYWPDALLAAPSDDALRADVEWAKRFGFNAARKHQKIEDPRWLYWCDRLGLMVWSETPNARAWSSEAEENLLAEWARAVRRDYNHPCVVAWVPVNESMGFPGLAESHPGQFAFLERIVAETRRLDSTRPVIDNDGWEHSDVTDICAIHDYTPTAAGLRERYAETLRGGPLPPTVWYRNKPLFGPRARYRGQPIMLTEVGGFLSVPPDIPIGQLDRLYHFYASHGGPDELLAQYTDLMQGLSELHFLAGFCYTQLTDIEQESNGLLTYAREPKLEPSAIAALMQRLFPP